MPRAKRTRQFACAALTLLALAPLRGALAADPTPDSRKLAMELPIADMHMHVFPSLTPDELKARMDRNNVRWGGAVGPIAMSVVDVQPFIDLLGDRYIPMAGQPQQHAIYFSAGAKGLADPEQPAFKGLMARADSMFTSGRIRGFGELILNNKESHPLQNFRRKAAVDSPTVRAMFASAERNKGIVQLHTENDDDSIAGLEALLKTHPAVPVILSHCLAVTLSPAPSDRLLKAYSQVYCELSARTDLKLPSQVAGRRIYGSDSVQASWLRSIEEFSDRYMVGTDVTAAQDSYDKLIGQIRTGLLPRLSAATARKVAYENAQKLFGFKL